jgi:hypothetical protein
MHVNPHREPGDDRPPTPADRRASVRYRCEKTAVGRAFIASSYRSVSARVVDLSVGGVGLVVDQPLEIGTRLHVELDGPASIPLELVAEIRNSVQQPDGSWRCGCELVWQLSEDEVRFLLK